MAGTQKIKIINILLGSVDGKIATNDTESSAQRRALQFTNTDDFKQLQKITAKCDAVFIGAKSLQSENGAFRVAHLRKNRIEPHWFVMTKTGKINFEHDFWKQKDIPKSIFHFDASQQNTVIYSSETMMQQGASEPRVYKREVHTKSTSNEKYYKGNIFDFLAILEKKKIKKIALLGGGELNGFFWEHNLVSELYLTLSPFIIGSKNAPQLITANHPLHAKLHLKNMHKKGDFLFLHYIIKTAI